MSSHSQSSWRYWVSLVGTAAAVRAVVNFVFLGSMPLVSDAASYAETAQDILAHFPGSHAYYWPPGMPYVLAAAYAIFGSTVLVARLTIMLVDLLTVVAVAALAQEMLREPKAARATGWVAAWYPPAVMMSGQPYAQQLAMLSLALLALCLWRGLRRGRLWHFIPAGAALGLGCLARPSMQSVVLVLILVWMVACRRMSPGPQRWTIQRGGPVLLLTMLAFLLPVMAHNAAYGQGWSLSTNNEKNFFLGNNPYTPNYKTYHIGQRRMDELDPDARDYQRSFRERPEGRGAMVREALRYIAAHPWMTVWRTLNRIRAYWGFDYVMSRQIQRHFDFGTSKLCLLLLVEAGGYCVVMAWVIVGCLGVWRTGGMPGGWLLLLLVLAYYAPYTLAYSGGTFRFPVMGLLMPFAGAGCAQVFWRGPEARRAILRNSWVWLGLIVFCLIQLEYAYYAMKYVG